MFLLLCLLTCSPHPARLFAKDLPPGVDPFSVHEYLGHLRFLSHDLLEGRGTGTRGMALCSAYLGAQFEHLGLIPVEGLKGYQQRVELTGFRTDYASMEVRLIGPNGATTVQPLEEICLSGERQEQSVHIEESDLLFVGYGIEAPEYKWDDFKGMDVADKILVCLVNDPDEKKCRFGTPSMTYYGRWAYKLEMARRKKARGIILIHHDEEATYGWAVVRNSWSGERVHFADSKDLPLGVQGWISHEALNRALAGTRLGYPLLKKKAESRRFKPFLLPVNLTARFNQTVRSADCTNTLAMIPGSDPKLKHEVVLYTAHADHLGLGLPDGLGDTIYNGASDNASGTAALLCLARAFRQNPVKPGRTLVFMAVTGEELGLLGSTWFVNHPPFPLEHIAVVINKDCMNHFGRRNRFSAFPVEYSSALEEVRQIGREQGLELQTMGIDRSGGAFRSDHFPFAARGIPALSLFMEGDVTSRSKEELEAARQAVGETYHQPGDEIHEAWVYDGTMQELNLLYRLGRHWADGAPKPVLNATGKSPYRSTQRWYGLVPDEDPS